jgi:outer membrane protein assembly factor BamB
MLKLLKRSSLVAVSCLIFSALVWAQGRNIGFEWPATSADAQRTNWLRVDPNIAPNAINANNFKLLWQEKLPVTPRQGAVLSPGVTANGMQVFTPTSFVTAVNNVVYALDNDTGHANFVKRFDAPLPAPTAQCPGGMTGALTRVVDLMPKALELPAAGGGNRGGGYRGAIGAPGEGVPLDIARRDGGAGLRGLPPPQQGQRGGGGGGLNAGKYNGAMYAVTSGGTLHVLGPNFLLEVEKPVPFLPANARFSNLIAVGETLYTSTSQGCGGAANGVWGISIAANSPRTVMSWKTNGGNPVGDIAFTTDGKLLVAVGAGQAQAGGYANAIIALDPKTLQATDWFTAPNADFVTTPVVLTAGTRQLVAAATRDGRVLVLDAASLGGADHATPLFASASHGANFTPDALATWETQGTRWLLVPGAGIVAYRVVDQGGRVSLTQGWTSRQLSAPAAPIIVNGVVFAAASGRPSGRATLYAFDGNSGRDLWNSGQTIASSLTPNGLWASNSQVHAATADGTVYAFGFPLERKAR